LFISTYVDLYSFTVVRLSSEAYRALNQNLTDGSNRAIMSHVSFSEPLPDPKNATYSVVKEKIITDFTGFLIYTNSFMCRGYLDKVMYLVESGIIEKIVSYFKPKKRPEDDDPVALSIDHLLIWFQLWAGCLFIAVVFFFLEILMKKIGKFWLRKQ
jgi:hypothetical protein